MLTVGVSVAAGLGAALRYAIDYVVQDRVRSGFPVGILVVNVSGTLVLGLATGLALHHGLGASTAVVIGAGFTGGYTTLSTWAWDTLALAGSRRRLAAAVNVVGSFTAGLAAAAAGLGLALL